MTFNNPQEAIDHIRAMYAAKNWPDVNNFDSSMLSVVGPNTRYLRYIEETMYECVKAQYPSVDWKRFIEVHPGRRYDIWIVKDTRGHGRWKYQDHSENKSNT